MTIRKTLVLGTVAAAAVGAGYLARRAVVRSARVVAVGGERPAYASLVWSYGNGARPLSLIVDLVASNGVSGSITTDGDVITGEIPLSGHFRGPYTITLTATYRVLGVASVVERTFAGTVADF